MTEENDTLVLRLLREIRAEVQAVRGTQSEHTHEFAVVKRQMTELQETTAMALGLSSMANAHYETTAQRIDRLASAVADLTARLEKLEEKA